MCFFIPDCQQRKALVELIEFCGGKILPIHECFSFQILPLNSGLNEKDFYTGEVFHSNWIIQSVE